MPRRTPQPPPQAAERHHGALEREYLARAVEQARWSTQHLDVSGGSAVVEPFPKPDTKEERWWDREAPDLLEELREPIDFLATSPVPDAQRIALEEAARADGPQAARARVAARRAAKIRDDDERRWSRKVNKRVRSGIAPSEAFEAADRRLAEWKKETGQ